LTIGGLLLSLTRAEAAGISEIEAIKSGIAQIRTAWRATWSQKAAREYRSRLELWRRALDDLLAEPEGRKAAYPSRVRVRVMLDLLDRELAPSRPARAHLLVDLDARLRAVTYPGAFVWETCFISGFPQNQYWYLYVLFDQPER